MTPGVPTAAPSINVLIPLRGLGIPVYNDFNIEGQP